MCYKALTRFSCPRCGSKWSAEVTRKFKTKTVICDDVYACKGRLWPTKKAPVLQYSADVCDQCFLDIGLEVVEKIGLSDHSNFMSKKERVEFVECYGTSRAEKARWWALNRKGTPKIYFGEPLTDKGEKLLRDLMDKSAKDGRS
jgi:transcription elongation factor Elf1